MLLLILGIRFKKLNVTRSKRLKIKKFKLVMSDLRRVRPIPTGSKSPKFYFLAVYFNLSSFVRLCQVIVGDSDVRLRDV